MKLRQTLLRFIETPPRGAERVSIDMGERSLDLYPRSPIAIDRALLFMGTVPLVGGFEVVLA